jgi:general secretion pathway protein I
MAGAGCCGFTLLEVMIALAILAIAMTSLFGSQSQALSLAIEAKFNGAAAFLAQEKLAEYEAGVVEMVSGEGDFGEPFPGFTWKTEVSDSELDAFADLAELERGLRRVELTIGWEEEQFTATFTEYVRIREKGL